MSQTLLDGTAETVGILERLRFLRKLEDSQSPIVMVDRQMRKHLVYVTKVQLSRPSYQLDKAQELEVRMVCVDASDHQWRQAALKLGVSLSYTAVLA